MKKTLEINLAGQLFRIDEDTLAILKRYLDHVTARFGSEPGGEETLQDIEARIAEIFGGGGDPPTLISKEMVSNMISIMGAPEEYYETTPPPAGQSARVRKPMYDPNTPSARLGRELSAFFTAFGKGVSAIMKIVAVVVGFALTLSGFLLFFLFALLIFFSDTAFLMPAIKPAITDSHLLFSILLNNTPVWPLLILAAMVILIPLAAITWLGVKLIFSIKSRYRVAGIVTFLVWIASLCALAILLGLQLPAYANHRTAVESSSASPSPDTVWIAAMKQRSYLEYDRYASAEGAKFFLNEQEKRLSGSVWFNIYSNEKDSSAQVTVRKRAYGASAEEAHRNVRQVEYEWIFSGDTLYLDEYYSLPAGAFWNGSQVTVSLSLPEGTHVMAVPGINPDMFRHIYGDAGAEGWQIRDGRLQPLK